MRTPCTVWLLTPCTSWLVGRHRSRTAAVRHASQLAAAGQRAAVAQPTCVGVYAPGWGIVVPRSKLGLLPALAP